MKRSFILLILLLLVAAQGLNGQKPIIVLVDSVQFGNNLYPGFNVTIPEAEYDKVLKNWVKAQESGTKSKVLTENGEMTIFGAMAKDITTSSVNIYSRLINEDSLSRLLVSIELKKDQYVEPAAGDALVTSVKTNLKEFAKEQYIDFIKDELAEEEKKLRDLNRELDGLESSKAKSQKTATNSRNTISEEQEKLLVMNNELSLLSKEILNKNNEMMTMPEGAGKDAMTIQIKDLEKSRSKLQKEIRSGEDRISKAKSAIDQADRAIPLNEDEQSVMKSRIEAQQAVVQKFIDKLNTVKQY